MYAIIISTGYNGSCDFISRFLNRLTNNSVPRPVLDNLVVGYSKFINEEPFREVILPIGNGFEDYLKHIASTRNPSIDLIGCNGIIQIGEKLKSNGIIAKKHLGAIGFIGHLRNSADHGIDSLETYDI